MADNNILLNRTEAVSDVDVSIVKLFSFVAVSALSALAAGYYIATAVTPSGILMGLITISLFCVLFALQSFFIKSRWRGLVATAIESLAMMMPILAIFKDNLSLYFLLAYAVLVIILFYGYDSGRHVLQESLKIPFWRTCHHVLAKAIPAVLIFVFIVYAFIANKTVAAENANLLYEHTIVPIARTSISDFNSGMSADDALGRIADKQGITEPQKSASVANVDKLISSYDFKTNEPIGTAIYDFFVVKLQSPNFLVKFYFAFILIALIWFVVKSIALILYIPLEAFALILYEILIATNFIAIQYESRSKEIILLK